MKIFSKSPQGRTVCIRTSRATIYLLSLTLFHTNVHAQVPPQQTAQAPSAGSILEGIKTQRPIFTLPQPGKDLEHASLLEDETGGERFTVGTVHFVGNQRVETSVLQKLIKPYIDSPVSFTELSKALDALTLYYRDEGWLVRIILPEQDITNGVLVIQILEASLGQILIDNQSKHVSSERVQAWIYNAIPRRTSISLAEFERAMLSLNDQPDLRVSNSLKEGAYPGETILLLTVTDKPAVEGVVGVDNFGQYATGLNRVSASISLNGLKGVGEQVNLFGLYTKGSNYERVAVTAPMSESGLRGGINASYLTYGVIEDKFSQLQAHGQSNSQGAELTYPVIRSQFTNLFVLGNYNYSSFSNFAVAQATSQYSTSVFQVSFSGNHQDGFFSGGVNSGSVVASTGMVYLNNSPSLSADQSGPQVNGYFNKLRYTLNRQQSITQNLTAYLGTSGQFASKNMDPSEQLYLGGPYGVRAYASGQASASQGTLSTFELLQTLPMHFVITGFYDYAGVQSYKKSNFSGAPADNAYALQGIGTSLGWSNSRGLQIKGMWAARTGNLPISVAQSLNQNSGNCCNRFWLTASVPF